MSRRESYYICPNCEAICGLKLTIEENKVVGIKGNSEDLMTLGHVCPKGVALMELADDPDLLRTPMVRTNGKLVPASWDEAFAVINEKLSDIIRRYGKESVALYVGNATLRSTAFNTGFLSLYEALATPHLYTANSVDALPKILTCTEMYGDESTNPVPDIDRTDYLLIIGANPIVSNGSLWLATNFRKRLRDLKKRNGKLVVVDPRRTETAKIADRHLFIRPGQDQYFLLAVLHVIYRDRLSKTAAIAPFVSGLDTIEALAKLVSLEQMSANCGIDASTIETIAHELATRESAGVYGRVGSTTQKYGTVTSWLIEVINIVTGNLDKPGGMMFARAPSFAANTRGKPGTGEPLPEPTFRSRVRNMPPTCGELPVACLAEEIETPGDGQIRALVTMCGNPASSAPNSERLDKALSQLVFFLSLDIYINETSRHADVILPGTPTFETCYYGVFSAMYAVRNVVRFSPALFKSPPGWVSDWDVLLQISAIAAGLGVQDEHGLQEMENRMISEILAEAAADEYSIAHGIDISSAMNRLSDKRGVERVLDAGFRVGPYGDGFGANPDGITLEKIISRPEGIDFGPLQPRIPEVLRTPSGKIELAPAAFMKEARTLLQTPPQHPRGEELLLIGRRHLRSINSWGHNIDILARGQSRCTLQVHPEDAQRLSLDDGMQARVSTNTGEIEISVEITEDMMPGVVSMPHGWGHDREGMRLNIAQQKPGSNINVLIDDMNLDTLSGTAVLNAIPVRITHI